MKYDNPMYHTKGGNNTIDKVYLLSIDDVSNFKYGFCEKYDTCRNDCCAKASEYAKRRGVETMPGGWSGTCEWWLQSP